MKELTHSDVSFTSIFFNDARVRKLKASYIVYLVESVPFLTTMRITHELASTAVGNGKGERTSVEEFQLKNRHLMTDGTFRVFPSIYLIRSTRDESKAFTLLVETFASHSDQFQTKFTVKDNNQIMTMAVNYLLVSHITRLQSSTAYPDLQSIAGKLIEVYISGHEYRGPTVT